MKFLIPKFGLKILTVVLLMTSCSVFRNDDIPDCEISRIAAQYPDMFSSDIKLFEEGDEIPADVKHLAMIKIIGKKNTSEEILWDYLKHHSLKIHANGLINVNKNVVVRTNRGRNTDTYDSSFNIIELSAIAIRTETSEFYWKSYYSSEYEYRIDDYLKKVRKENKKYFVIPVLSGVALATVLILTK